MFTDNFKYVLEMTREFSFKLLLDEYLYSLACSDRLNDRLNKYSESRKIKFQQKLKLIEPNSFIIFKLNNW